MKRYLAMLGAAMFFVACFSLYLMMESVSSSNNAYGMDGSQNIEEKIGQIEKDLKRNHETINQIRDTVKKFAVDGDKQGLEDLQKVLGWDEKEDSIDNVPPVIQHVQHPFNSGSKRNFTHQTCQFAETLPPKTDIQMVDVFDKLPFDNPDGGVWKQGYPISYSVNQFKDQPLQVFVVPHSHNDPGWLKTFERYYSDQTRHILNNMVDKLEAYPKMKFIYAEISFFSLWWAEIDNSKKERVKRLIKEKRLEIVTGGWVMPDEANTHFYAMLDQLIEGNQWLLNQLDVTPRAGWAIDPFGHSSTNAYLLKGIGLSNMLVQRIHYSIKKYLAQQQKLEFMWRQNWDHDGTTDMSCHMMPFYSYDVPHTCGPEPSVCCQFDFKRLPGGKISCPWKVAPVPITDSNVETKTQILLDQYRKKAQLYKNNNVVLIPLGDDFRYDKASEWDQQYTNYQKMFDYMNNRPDWYVQAQFGTLSDYFDAVAARSGSQPGAPPSGLPVLSGDFYTYADKDDQYWSGYFTSRPFYKRLDREFEAHLRSGEVLYSLAVAESRRLMLRSFPEEVLMRRLVTARRNLGINQHHDAITGTAKDLVVVDYGTRMLESIKDLKGIIRDSAQFLLMEDKQKYDNNEQSVFFDIDEQRPTHDSLPEKTVMKVGDNPRSVIFYNSLSRSQVKVVQVFVNAKHVEVEDVEGNIIDSQVDPYWNSLENIADNKFKVLFVASVPAMGISKYCIRSVSPGSNPSHTVASVSVYNTKLGAAPPHGDVEGFVVKKESGTDFHIENSVLKARISTLTGMLQEFTVKQHNTMMKSRIQFVSYGVANSKERSGAYLFLPDGPAKTVEYQNPYIRVITGPVSSQVHTFLPMVEHTLTLYNSPGLDGLSVDIRNLVDIRERNNLELAMRIHTAVYNKDETFYTDLNGFQMQKRRTYQKLPLQANYYPMPTMAYIEDDKNRFTILSAQSLGCASLQQGFLEVMQDRRLNQDDNRGLGQGVLDNKRTPNKFKLLFESRSTGKQPLPTQPVGYPSLVAHLASQELIHPVMVLPQAPAAPQVSMLPVYRALTVELPCDVHVVTFRTMQYPENNPDLRFKPKESIALLLHRLGIDCTLPTTDLSCPLNDGTVIFSKLFNDLEVSSVQPSSLSLVHDGSTVSPSEPVRLPIMEIQAFKLKLK